MFGLRIIPLWSSSKGNATIVTDGETNILVDCGVSGKALEQGLHRMGISGDEIFGILVTHEHSDHIKGIGIASRKYNLPIFANEDTWRHIKTQLGKIADENIRVFDTGVDFYINQIRVKSFRTPHDAVDSVGYTFEKNFEKVAVATDMGFVSDEILSAISGSGQVLLEANYDSLMLDAGSYPYELKCRIKGERGHLCNDDSGYVARALAASGTREIILGHLSEENNFPRIAFETVCQSVKDFETRVLVVLRDGSITNFNE